MSSQKKLVRFAIGWIKQRKDALENWHPFPSWHPFRLWNPQNKFFALTMLKAILQQLNKCIYIYLQSYKIHYPSINYYIYNPKKHVFSNRPLVKLNCWSQQQTVTAVFFTWMSFRLRLQPERWPCDFCTTRYPSERWASLQPGNVNKNIYPWTPKNPWKNEGFFSALQIWVITPKNEGCGFPW